MSVGDVLCGVASVRRVGSFGGYTLAVAGQPASQTSLNDLRRGQNYHRLDLVVK